MMKLLCRVDLDRRPWKIREDGAISAPQDAVICRLGAVSDFEQQPGIPELFDEDKAETILFTGCGDGCANGRCNALYSCSTDTAMFFVGCDVLLTPEAPGKFRLDSTAVEVEAVLYLDFMRTIRHLHNFTPLDKSHFPQMPAGWCSWYSYYQKITSAELRRNVDFLAETLKPYGLEWIQLDDGWQGRGEGHATNRNFLTICKEKFPEGLRAESDYIRRKGFRPGLWCIPFMQSAEVSEYPEKFRNKEIYVTLPGNVNPQFHPERKDAECEDDRYEWGGKYLIDPTGATGSAYIRHLAHLLADEYGFDFLKIDSQGGLADNYQRCRRSLADPTLDGITVYRKAVGLVKEVLGPNRFLLNCAWGFGSTGLFDAIRTGPDVIASWEGIKTAATATFNWLFLNTYAFRNDPDVLCVRDPLSYQEGRLWTTMLGLTGQFLLLSDFMPELPADRLELLKKVLPVAEIHPMDLFPHRAPKAGQIISLNVSRPGLPRYMAAGVLNFSDDTEYAAALSAEMLGLDPDAEYVITDFWSEKIVHDGKLPFDVRIAPHDSTVLGIWKRENHPVFIGSTRHITLGAVDVKQAQWDDARQCLRFEAETTPGDHTRYYFYLPEKYRDRPLPDALERVSGSLCRLTAGNAGTLKTELAF